MRMTVIKKQNYKNYLKKLVNTEELNEGCWTIKLKEKQQIM